VCLDGSAQLAIDALKLPVKNVAAGLPAEQFFCPGSLLKIDIDTSLPVGFGMPPQNAAFFAFSSAYDVAPGSNVRAIARYGQKDILMSGWLEGEAVIAGKAAVVEARAGAGRVVLIGFRAQHRGQSLATFRFLFNAVLTGGAEQAR